MFVCSTSGVMRWQMGRDKIEEMAPGKGKYGMWWTRRRIVGGTARQEEDECVARERLEGLQRN